MSTTDRALRALREMARQLPDTLRLEANRLLDDATEREAAPVTFRWLGQDGAEDLFEISIEGGPVHVHRTSLRGVWLAWAAINDAGRTKTLRAADFAEPGSPSADKNVSKAVRRTAADWFRSIGCPQLEIACARISVEGGLVRYKPELRDKIVIT
ncbi:hypothetical protein ACIGHJ_07965 [Stutzerimonas kunmingensis]|uniref:hypothetical protein n=1 Tax=Stutzerimonas kunmingensis TaxID=1211807 RepID=UPI0037D4D094